MSSPRKSNLERQRWRTECRILLSEHIKNKIGIEIEPLHVRLLPGPSDPYRWDVMPERQHLFSKNISDHSIGAYKELCNGVGVTFEAVLATRRTKTGTQDSVLPMVTEISFSARIEALQQENARLYAQIDQAGIDLFVQSESLSQAERELEQVQEENRRLKRELEQNLVEVEDSRNNLERYVQGLAKVVPLLEELKKEFLDIPTD